MFLQSTYQQKNTQTRYTSYFGKVFQMSSDFNAAIHHKVVWIKTKTGQKKKEKYPRRLQHNHRSTKKKRNTKQFRIVSRQQRAANKFLNQAIRGTRTADEDRVEVTAVSRTFPHAIPAMSVRQANYFMPKRTVQAKTTTNFQSGK